MLYSSSTVYGSPFHRKKNQDKAALIAKQKAQKPDIVREIPQVSSSLFYQHNTALIPPYSVLVDTK